MSKVSRNAIVAVMDEFNYVIGEFSRGNLTRGAANDLLNDIKKTAASQGIPLVVDEKNSILDKIAASQEKAKAEEFDDSIYDEEESSSEEEYSEDEE